MNDITYSKLIHGLKLAGVDINRKMLSEMAVDDPDAFTGVVGAAKEALAAAKDQGFVLDLHVVPKEV